MRRHLHFFAESSVNTFSGMLGSYLITILTMSYVRDPAKAAAITVSLCTIWSLIRGYFWRLWIARRSHQRSNEMSILSQGDGNSLVEQDMVTNLAASILNWFEKAMPTPTDKNRAVQLGCHCEEVAETLEACGTSDGLLFAFAEFMKKSGKTIPIEAPDFDRLEFLDGLMDTIVTSIGTAYVYGFDVLGALAAVDKNNWSKFVNGEPQFDENGKIMKPAGYVKVDLTPFLTRS